VAAEFLDSNNVRIGWGLITTHRPRQQHAKQSRFVQAARAAEVEFVACSRSRRLQMR
jgi:hypothetical protein